MCIYKFSCTKSKIYNKSSTVKNRVKKNMKKKEVIKINDWISNYNI